MKKIGAVYEKWKKLWKSVEVQTNMKVYFESTHCKLLTSLIIFFPNFIWSWWITEWKTCKIFHCEENNAQKKTIADERHPSLHGSEISTWIIDTTLLV